MQKDTYFNPSYLKNIKELTWLSYSNTRFLWIYEEKSGLEQEIESMLINKLIENPKILDTSTEHISILKFSGKERFHFLKKNFPLEKIVLFGVNPELFGIHIQFPEYEIIRHLDYYFLKLGAPETLADLNRQHKILLASKLKELADI